MAIDITQFHQVFFEECFEGLDVMETELMKLDVEQENTIDNEVINTIFRAAHSIKGGSGTFGFGQVSSFTHGLETLLDQIRSGERDLKKNDVDVFLRCVDCLREMLTRLRDKVHVDMSAVNELSVILSNLLNNHTREAPVERPIDKTSSETIEKNSKHKVWEIYFKPGHDVFKSGNDPQPLFRELAKLGNLVVTYCPDDLPPFDEMDPLECYLAWNIELRGNIERSSIDEVFEWVVDESELTIKEALITKEIKEESIVHEEKPDLGLVRSSVRDVEGGVNQTDAVATGKSKSAAANAPESSSIRVSIDKIDSLINLVGELVITQSMLGQLGEKFEMSKLLKLREGLSQLKQNTRGLQESVMRIRMLPISFSFNRFPRMVRDMAQQLDKKIDLIMVGESTELDKTVMEKIGDPLVHLVRNSVDHGIESVENRKAAGKSETGTITLKAFHQGGHVMIQISDDGAGLNAERILNKAKEKGLVGPNENLSPAQIHDLIFMPGFSTAEVVSDISGRGVGMDVVRRNIHGLGGSIEIESEQGKGTTFSVRLPLTLAILDGQLVSVGEHIYILPLVSIVESLQVKIDMINAVGGGCDVLRLRNEYIPILRLSETFHIQANCYNWTEGLVVVVESGGEKVGLLVDDLQAQQQVVIKSLEQNYEKVEGISGATILGDGTVALILDMAGIVKLAGMQYRTSQNALIFHKQDSRESAARVA
jgi:two-component system chemotaxis sensor kinase CheA